MTTNLYDMLSNAMSNAASDTQPKEANMPSTSELLASLTSAVEVLKEIEERKVRMNLLLGSRKDMLPMRWKLRPADRTVEEPYIHIQVPSVLPDNGHKGNRSYGAVIDIPVSTLREAVTAEIQGCEAGDTKSLAGTGKTYSHGWLILDFSFFPGAVSEKFPPFISLLLSATPAVTGEHRELFATDTSKDADLFTLNQRFFTFALAEVNYREMHGCMKYVLQGQYGSEQLDVESCDLLSNLADTPQYTVTELDVDDDILASFGEDLYHTDDEEGSEQNGEENGDQETWSPGLDYDPHAIS